MHVYSIQNLEHKAYWMVITAHYLKQGEWKSDDDNSHAKTQ